MTTYTIVVNGKTYEVEVEKKGSTPAARVSAPVSQAAPAPTAVAPTPAPQAPAPQAAPVSGGAGNKISAPMPGKIISVKVSVGDSVKKGQELIVMEAMKMHNPVLAANDGVVKEIYVKAGDPVQTGAPLISVG